MKKILEQTWINVLLGLGFMAIAFVVWAFQEDFNGFISMMLVAFFNFVIVLYEAAGAIYDKLDEIEKKMGAKN
jgi:ABC-type uncharacterized transport system permease subunit